MSEIIKRKSFLHSHTFQHAFYYLYYCLMFILVQTLVVSIIAFFHFLLDHNFKIIEAWVYRSSWEIVIISKGVSLGLIFIFLDLKGDNTRSFLREIKEELTVPHYSVFLFIFFIYFNILWLGDVAINEERKIDFSFQVLSYFGTCVFFMTDYLLLNYLSRTYPLRRKAEQYIYKLIVPFIIFLVIKMAVPFAKNLNILLVVHFLALLYIRELTHGEWTVAFLYIILLVAPLSAFFGMDMMWGDLYSWFKLNEPLPLLVTLGLWFIGIFYLTKNTKDLQLT